MLLTVTTVVQAAAKVRDLRKSANSNHTGNEEYNFFLTVIFPESQLNIMPYNRVVKDLNGLDAAQFLTAIATSFEVATCVCTTGAGGTTSVWHVPWRSMVSPAGQARTD